jgi:hypothetical protein
MKILRTLQDGWQTFLDRLPAGLDLDQTLREFGGLKRRRRIADAQTLLRLALVYSLCGLSLRATAAWAQAQGLAQLSDVALMKRLGKAAPWLKHLLGAKLAQRAQGLKDDPGTRRLRIVDATTCSVSGSRGTDYRIHMGFDLQALRVDQIEITGPEGGESLTRQPFSPGDLVLADRGYAHRRGLASVLEAQADFLVRITWQNLPLQDDQQHRIDLVQVVKGLDDEEVLDLDVWTVAVGKQGLGSMAARLIAIRKTKTALEVQRKKVQQKAGRKGRKADPQSLIAAEYVLLLTSVPRQELSAQKVLDLYRLRWQIEMAFKRLKGLVLLDDLPSKNPELVTSCLCAKLLAGLMLEDLTQDFLAFSPSGSLQSPEATEPVEDPADPARCPDLLAPRIPQPIRAPGQSRGFDSALP